MGLTIDATNGMIRICNKKVAIAINKNRIRNVEARFSRQTFVSGIRSKVRTRFITMFSPEPSETWHP